MALIFILVSLLLFWRCSSDIQFIFDFAIPRLALVIKALLAFCFFVLPLMAAFVLSLDPRDMLVGFCKGLLQIIYLAICSLL